MFYRRVSTKKSIKPKLISIMKKTLKAVTKSEIVSGLELSLETGGSIFPFLTNFQEFQLSLCMTVYFCYMALLLYLFVRCCVYLFAYLLAYLLAYVYTFANVGVS